MASISHKSMIKHRERLIPVNNGVRTFDLPWVPKVLKGVLARADELLVKRGKVFVVIVTQHIVSYTKSNAPATELISRLKTALDIKFKFFDMHYLWVREHSSGEKQHYHWALILDATRVSTIDWLFNFLEGVVRGCSMTVNVHFSGYHLLKARELEKENWKRYYKFVWHVSYLAKLNTKTKKPRGTRSYDFSRLTPVS